MKYITEYRDVKFAKPLIDKIRRLASRPWVLMDVCGGQTHSLVRSGIERELAGHVELIHGPGCPVCVTSTEKIDFAVALSMQPGFIVASFGDMLRVPGSQESLMQARARGGNIRIVYSPMDALTIARQNPKSEVVFFAVGFETTAPATSLAILQAAELELDNFSIVPAHVRVLPAMEAIMQMQDNRVEGFLAAGHVCSVTGFDAYDAFVQKHQVPVAVTGFEPNDLLIGIFHAVEQLEENGFRVENHYGRSVERAGNTWAQSIVHRIYKVDDREWRGFGRIVDGGYSLRKAYAHFDASRRFGQMLPVNSSQESRCRGADVMSGRLKPRQCPEFGKTCTPTSPVGAPMVSSEGACAAYYRFEPHAIRMQP